MTGIVGIVTTSRSIDEIGERLSIMLNHVSSSLRDNDVVKLFREITCLAVVVPRERGLYFISESERGFVLIYGYLLARNISRFQTPSFMIGKTKNELKNVLAKVDGSFTAVIVDETYRHIYIITDRFATRPLFYATIGNDLVFSSSFWALISYLRATKRSIEINEDAIVEYLWFGGRIGLLGDKTFVKGIHITPSASIISFDMNSCLLDVDTYWELNYSPKIRDRREALKQVYTTLVKSIVKTVKTAESRGTRKLWIELSGGLDSRILATVLSKLKKTSIRIEAVTFGTKKSDEVYIARKVAKKLKLPHNVYIYTLDHLADYAYDTVKLSEGFSPIHWSHTAFLTHLLTTNDCDVAMNGFELDLLLGGSFMSRHLLTIKNYKDFIASLFGRTTVFTYEELYKLLQPKLRVKLREISRSFINEVGNTIFGERNYLNTNDKFFVRTRLRRLILGGILIERNAIEVLLPTIGKDFIEALVEIDPLLRKDRFLHRDLLLILDQEISLIPYQKTYLPPILPVMLWNLGFVLKKINNVLWKISRGKLGFEPTYFDFNKALRSSLKWRKLLEETLLQERSLIYTLGCIDRSYVHKLVIEHLSGKNNNGEKLGLLITLEIILRYICGSFQVSNNDST